MRPNALLVLVGVALVMRVGAVAATPSYAPSGDPADYHRHAHALTTTSGFAPTALAEPGGASALRPPLYPLTVAAVYELTGVRFTPVRIVGVLLGALTVALIFLLAQAVFDRSVARWAGGLAAVYPPLVWLSAGLSAENLFIPLVLGAVLALVHVHRTVGHRWAVLAGLLIGLAALTRSNGLVLLLTALLAVGLAPAGVRERLRAGAVLAGVLVLALVPWTVRNAAEFGGLRVLGTQSGYTIAGQYNPTAATPDDFQGVWRTPDSLPEFKGLFQRPGFDEAELDAELRSRGIDYALDHPSYVARVIGLNTQRLFDLGPNHEFTRSVSYGEMGIPAAQHGVVTNWVHLVLLLAVAGAVVLVRQGRRGPLWLWSAPVLLFASVVWLLGAPRYRIPVDPFLLVLAGAALSAAWAELARRRASQRSSRARRGAASV